MRRVRIEDVFGGYIMWEISGVQPFVLAPKHAAVFRVAAASLSDFVGWGECDNDHGEIGIEVFDMLSQGQKQLAILTVAKALLDPQVAPPTISAVFAGTAHAIYCQLECLIEIAVPQGGEYSIRQLLLEAIAEKNDRRKVDGDDEPITPSAESGDIEKWNDLVESLRTDILEDYDFAIDSYITIMAPSQAAQLMDRMNIHPNYFITVVEDPVPKRLKQFQFEIRKLFN
jgi:hypothetical protein